MNKEQSLAAHRLKKSVAMAARNESLAKKKTKIAEAKMAKMQESFEVAKDIVNKQKATLELAKQQILEQRELIKRYEALINLKYQQIEESKKSAVKSDEALKARVGKFVETYNSTMKTNEDLTNTIAKQREVLGKAKECIISLKEANSKLESAISRRAKVECDVNKNVTPKVAPVEDQKPKEVKDATVAKVQPEGKVDLDKFNEEKATKIAEIFKNKYGVDEKESMRIFGKYGMMEAVERIQTIANTLVKPEPEAKVETKAEEKKEETKEVKSEKKIVKPAIKRVNKAAESVNKRIVRPAKKEEAKVKPMAKAAVETKSNKIDEAKAIKIAKIYNQKYKMDETASMNILRAYDQKTALEKLQSIANVTKKYITEAKEVKPETKVDEAKEAKAAEGTNLYSLFM